MFQVGIFLTDALWHALFSVWCNIFLVVVRLWTRSHLRLIACTTWRKRKGVAVTVARQTRFNRKDVNPAVKYSFTPRNITQRSSLKQTVIWSTGEVTVTPIFPQHLFVTMCTLLPVGTWRRPTTAHVSRNRKDARVTPFTSLCAARTTTPTLMSVNSSVGV